jgi:CelD/BcsL family acetyltransferase involved in cellulose biosynthesis
MKVETIQLEVVTTPVAFHALNREWEDLWHRANGRHHQAFRVCWLCWLHAAKPHGKKLRCIVLREEGRLVLVWPLVSARKLLWTSLLPLGPEATEYTSMLVEGGPSAPALIAQAWQAAQQCCGADFIHLPYVSANSDLHRLASSHPHVMAADQHSCAVAKLSEVPDWDKFCASLGTLAGRKPGALQRRLSKEGKLEARFLGPDEPDEIAKMIDWLLAHKREWALRVNKKGEWLYSSSYRDFLIDLLSQNDGKILAHLFVVALDGAPIAVSVCGVGKTCAIGIIASFDANYYKFAPGSVAIEHWVKWAFEHRLDFDLGIGSERFKSYWSRNNISVVWSLHIANTRWGLLALQANDLRRALAKWGAQWRGALSGRRVRDSRPAQPDLGEDRVA